MREWKINSLNFAFKKVKLINIIVPLQQDELAYSSV